MSLTAGFAGAAFATAEAAAGAGVEGCDAPFDSASAGVVTLAFAAAVGVATDASTGGIGRRADDCVDWLADAFAVPNAFE